MQVYELVISEDYMFGNDAKLVELGTLEDINSKQLIGLDGHVISDNWYLDYSLIYSRNNIMIIERNHLVLAAKSLRDTVNSITAKQEERVSKLIS